MSDRIPAEIAIGGSLSRAVAGKLAKVVRAAGLSWEYGGLPYRPGTAKSLIRDAQNAGGCLTLCDDEARNGEFPDLEEFLVDNKIPFDRHTSARYGYDAELIRYRPGMAPAWRVYHANEDQEVMVRASELFEVRLAMAEASHDLAQRLAEAVVKIGNLIGVDDGDLPPLTVKE